MVTQIIKDKTSNCHAMRTSLDIAKGLFICIYF